MILICTFISWRSYGLLTLTFIAWNDEFFQLSNKSNVFSQINQLDDNFEMNMNNFFLLSE